MIHIKSTFGNPKIMLIGHQDQLFRLQDPKIGQNLSISSFWNVHEAFSQIDNLISKKQWRLYLKTFP